MVEIISCLKCGKCCKSLIEEHEGLCQGIFLFPEEAIKLEKIGKQKGIDVKIVPKDGVSKFGSITPEIIFSFQFEDDLCPFFDEKTNSCSIYDDRPTTCRAYPIVLCYKYLMLTSDCSSVEDRKTNGFRYKVESFADSAMNYSIFVVNWIQKHVNSENADLLWYFDLKTKSWMVTIK